MRKFIGLLLLLITTNAFAGLSTEDSVKFKQIATPSNPSAGYDKVYVKNDDKLYILTSAGAESAVGVGDITSVGDVSSGAAFDGTQGTVLTFNNAGGDATLTYDGTYLSMTSDLEVANEDPFVLLRDTTVGHKDWAIRADGSAFDIYSTPAGGFFFSVDSSENVTIGDSASPALILGALTTTQTVSADGANIMTLTNSDADRAADSTILTLQDYDDNDDNSYFIKCIGDADGTPYDQFYIRQNASTSANLYLSSAGQNVVSTIETGTTNRWSVQRFYTNGDDWEVGVGGSATTVAGKYYIESLTDSETLTFDTSANAFSLGTTSGVSLLDFGSLALGFGGITTYNTITGDAGIFTLASVGNTNNEKLIIDLEGTANRVDFTTDSGIVNFNFLPGGAGNSFIKLSSLSTGNFTEIDLITNGTDWLIGAGGSTATNYENKLYISGVSEELTLAESANTMTIASNTSVNSLVLSSIDLSTPVAVLSGTPNAAGEIGYDSTQKMVTTYGGATAVAGSVSRVLTVGVGTETKTDDSTSDHDYATLYTFPANSIYTNKVYRVTVWVEQITGVSAGNVSFYLKLGGTDVVRSNPSSSGDSLTTSSAFEFYIIGRAAAGAAANVTTMPLNSALISGNSHSRTNQPVALATNGTLTCIFGVDWSTSASTETVELQGWMVEELN